MPIRRSDTWVWRVAGFALLFLIIATIVFVFVKTLVFQQPINDQALRQALVAASVGVTLSCLIAWVLDLLQVIELRAGWGKLLWTVLVASILTSSALAYKQWQSAAQTNAVNVTCVRALAIDNSTGKWRDPSVVLNQELHKKGGTFGFLVAATNFQTDSNGDYAVDIRWEYDDRPNATFALYSYSANAEKLRADPAHLKRVAEYTKVVPECIDDKGETLEFKVLSNLEPSDPRPGIHELEVTVYDKVGKGFAEGTLITTLVGGESVGDEGSPPKQ